MQRTRAFPISSARRKLLAELWENRDTKKGELTCSIPGGWWLGNKRVNGNVGTWLLRYSLLRRTFTDAGNEGMGRYTVYVASGEVGRLLDDPGYVPEGAVVVQKWLAARH